MDDQRLLVADATARFHEASPTWCAAERQPPASLVRSRKAAASTTSGNDRHGITSSAAASSATSTYSILAPGSQPDA